MWTIYFQHPQVDVLWRLLDCQVDNCNLSLASSLHCVGNVSLVSLHVCNLPHGYCKFGLILALCGQCTFNIFIECTVYFYIFIWMWITICIWRVNQLCWIYSIIIGLTQLLKHQCQQQMKLEFHGLIQMSSKSAWNTGSRGMVSTDLETSWSDPSWGCDAHPLT